MKKHALKLIDKSWKRIECYIFVNRLGQTEIFQFYEAKISDLFFVISTEICDYSKVFLKSQLFMLNNSFHRKLVYLIWSVPGLDNIKKDKETTG